DAEAEMRRSPHPRVDLEIAGVRLCERPRPEAIETIRERLEQAEARLRGYGGSAEPAAPSQPHLPAASPHPGLPAAHPADRPPPSPARVAPRPPRGAAP